MKCSHQGFVSIFLAFFYLFKFSRDNFGKLETRLQHPNDPLVDNCVHYPLSPSPRRKMRQHTHTHLPSDHPKTRQPVIQWRIAASYETQNAFKSTNENGAHFLNNFTIWSYWANQFFTGHLGQAILIQVTASSHTIVTNFFFANA